eukprot:1161581-Pelagomonas_calceolata.AAC.1
MIFHDPNDVPDVEQACSSCLSGCGVSMVFHDPDDISRCGCGASMISYGLQCAQAPAATSIRLQYAAPGRGRGKGAPMVPEPMEDEATCWEDGGSSAGKGSRHGGACSHCP